MGRSLNQEIWIVDNEKPVLTFASSDVTVVEEDINKDVELTFNLSGPIANAVDINYSTVDGSAEAGTDFIGVTGVTATIPANQTSIPIMIRIQGDNANEGNESFKVRVATPPY